MPKRIRVVIEYDLPDKISLKADKAHALEAAKTFIDPELHSGTLKLVTHEVIAS